MRKKKGIRKTKRCVDGDDNGDRIENNRTE